MLYIAKLKHLDKLNTEKLLHLHYTQLTVDPATIKTYEAQVIEQSAQRAQSKRIIIYISFVNIIVVNLLTFPKHPQKVRQFVLFPFRYVKITESQ